MGGKAEWATPPKGQRQSPKAIMGMGTQSQLIYQGPARLVPAGAGSCMEPCTVVEQGEEIGTGQVEWAEAGQCPLQQ